MGRPQPVRRPRRRRRPRGRAHRRRRAARDRVVAAPVGLALEGGVAAAGRAARSQAEVARRPPPRRGEHARRGARRDADHRRRRPHAHFGHAGARLLAPVPGRGPHLIDGVVGGAGDLRRGLAAARRARTRADRRGRRRRAAVAGAAPASTSRTPAAEAVALAFAEAEKRQWALPDPALLRRLGAEQRASRRTPSTASPSASSRPSNHFKIPAQVIGTVSGPRVTRYELQLAPGIKVSRVAGLKDDLAYALAATDVRVLAPIPGKTAVGVEVPNDRGQLRLARRHPRPVPAARLADGLLARQGRHRQGRARRPRAHGPPAHRRAPPARARAAASTRSSPRSCCAPRRTRCA